VGGHAWGRVTTGKRGDGGCLSLLTMPLIRDSDCDGEHNFPLLRILR
jgi:hypothetical protein